MSTTYPAEIQFCSGDRVETIHGELSITGGIMDDGCEKNIGTLGERLGYLQMTLHKIKAVLLGDDEGTCAAVSGETVRSVGDVIGGHIDTVMHLEKCADEILRWCGEIVELLG